MAMEKICRAEGGGGRLIPVPRTITAGCGLAWSAKPEDRDRLLLLLESHRINYEAVYEMEL